MPIKGGKNANDRVNENDRVVSPENIPIHLNDLSTLGNTLIMQIMQNLHYLHDLKYHLLCVNAFNTHKETHGHSCAWHLAC